MQIQQDGSLVTFIELICVSSLAKSIKPHIFLSNARPATASGRRFPSQTPWGVHMNRSRRLLAKAIVVVGMGAVALFLPRHAQAQPTSCYDGSFCYPGCPGGDLCVGCPAGVEEQCEIDWSCPGELLVFCGYNG
jgi:hypothetical protein